MSWATAATVLSFEALFGRPLGLFVFVPPFLQAKATILKHMRIVTCYDTLPVHDPRT